MPDAGWNPSDWNDSPIAPLKQGVGTDLTISTLAVTFADESELQPTVILEQTTKNFNLHGFLLFKVYPIDVKYRASIGSITGGETIEKTIREGVKFSNSNTAKLKYPKAYDVVFKHKSVMLKQKIDNNGNLDIVEFSQKITFNSDLDMLVAEEPFYGGVSVEYKVLCRVLYYKPEIFKFPFGGVSLNIGTIYAWKKLTVAIKEAEIADQDLKDYEELYRVTSKIVMDPEGVWEYPQNWLTVDNVNKDIPQGSSKRTKHPMGQFTGYTEHEIDPDVSMTDERLHKSGLYNFMGQVTHQTHKPHSRYEFYAPYTFNDSYIPVYTLTWKKPTWKPDMTYEEELFFEAFWSIDLKGIFDDLSNEFPGLINEGI